MVGASLCDAIGFGSAEADPSRLAEGPVLDFLTYRVFGRVFLDNIDKNGAFAVVPNIYFLKIGLSAKRRKPQSIFLDWGFAPSPFGPKAWSTSPPSIDRTAPMVYSWIYVFFCFPSKYKYVGILSASRTRETFYKYFWSSHPFQKGNCPNRKYII